MSNYDASITNNSKRANRIYKDLDLNFGRNVVTNDVNRLTDVEAVKRSVRNLLNTRHYERPFHPEIGAGVRDLLFEPITPLTAINLKRKVEEHNDKHGDDPKKKVNLRMLSAVFNRGVGAYRTNPASVRPGVRSEEQWAYARVNAFLFAVVA